MTDQETRQKIAQAKPTDLIFYKPDEKGNLKIAVEPQAGTCITCEQPLTEEDIAYAHDIHGEICHNCAEERQYNAYDSKEYKNEPKEHEVAPFIDTTPDECQTCDYQDDGLCHASPEDPDKKCTTDQLPEDCKDCPMNLQNKICKDTDGQHQCKYSTRGETQ